VVTPTALTKGVHVSGSSAAKPPKKKFERIQGSASADMVLEIQKPAAEVLEYFPEEQ